MTPEESRLLRVGASVVAAGLRGDRIGQAELLGGFRDEPARLAEAFAYVAVAAATIDATVSGRNLSQVLDDLSGVEAGLVSGSPIRWADAVDLAIGISRGNQVLIAEASAHMDVPTAINSTYSLALGVLADLERRTDRPSADWADALTEGSTAS